jgi:outer membrane protein OmpA-like peptidoglycan-associated protein
MRKFFLLLALFCAGTFNIYAQSAKWEVMPTVFSSNYMGDLVATVYPTMEANSWGAGLAFRRNLGERWALRAGGYYSVLEGTDLNFADRFGQRGFSFSSQIGELSLLTEFDMRGSTRYNKGYLKRTLSPYVFAGIGGVYSIPDVNFNLMENPRIAADRQHGNEIAAVVPFGAGLRYDLSKKTTLGVETGLRWAISDYLDGISASANPEMGDWYMFAGVTLSFRLGRLKDTDGDKVFDRYDLCKDVPGEMALDGCPDADGDGIIDEKDECPFQRGAAVMNGCPDRDADGVSDKKDRCPDVRGVIALMGCPDQDHDSIPDIDDICPDKFGPIYAKGCPDTDLDSIPDLSDKCPLEKGLAVNEGCPDRDKDNDGVVDRLDKCPEKAGLRVFDGCPDTDGDGVADALDKCPEKAGLRVFDGCPDTDGDGIADLEDNCPDKAGLKNFGGCPDTDGDGVMDKEDRCPSTAGVVANKGCPEIKKEELKILTLAMTGVKFDVGKSTLRKESFPVLDNVAALMQKYPSYQLDIRGYTDSDGNDAKNKALSETRAKACLDYLVKKGVEKTRLKSAGFGEASPLVPNTTKPNKAQNRRVEFEMILP